MKLAKSQTSPDSRNRSTVPQPDRKSVLLLVHLQNDFCPGGALAVVEGDQVIPVANACIRFFTREGFSIVATRDWHPENHCSFQAQGGPWHPHCVQGSWGSQFHPDLKMAPGTLIVSGATNARQEAYSGFDGTSLEERLEDLEVQTLFVIGLATDYCVKKTVLDACRLGFRVVVLEDGVRGINAQPKDSQKALEEMQAAGAMIANSTDLGIPR
ncbi:MAG: bifunctional nicotinamidase/pyrazinamidase [Nitrospinae bacterium]|nr:bifunctional nicotinamidase/pyrazinamidase [Nitrospinota bacterium]